jgi:chromosome partitioning protein
MTIISLAIQKGGTGKTTSAVMLSALLAKRGRKVLLIDMDPQANATECIADPQSIDKCIGDVLLRRANISETTQATSFLPQNLFYIPSKPSMLIDEYFGHFTSIFPDTLKAQLSSIRDQYDYVMIDCPPNLMHFTKNALWASDYVVIPLEPEPLAFEGLRQFIVSILPDATVHNPNLKPGGAILVNRAPAVRKYLPEEIKNRIRQDSSMGPSFLFGQEIRLDQQLAKMSLFNRPATEYAIQSNGVQDYIGLAAEFEVRIPP